MFTKTYQLRHRLPPLKKGARGISNRPFIPIGMVVAIFLCTSCGSDVDRTTKVLPLTANRAFSGAPPTITHEVGALGRASCQSCHFDGKAIDAKGVLAPITPHPELAHCTQCHVESTTRELFKKNGFAGRTFLIGQRAQPNGPWLIPHPITLRENCVGCHDAAHTVARLRTDHPEREHCVQCHLPVNSSFPTSRPGWQQPDALTFLEER